MDLYLVVHSSMDVYFQCLSQVHSPGVIRYAVHTANHLCDPMVFGVPCMVCCICCMSDVYRNRTSKHSLLDQMSTNSSTATPFAFPSGLRVGHDRQQRNMNKTWSWWGASLPWSSFGPTTVTWRGQEICQAPVISICLKLAFHQFGRYVRAYRRRYMNVYG